MNMSHPRFNHWSANPIKDGIIQSACNRPSHSPRQHQLQSQSAADRRTTFIVSVDANGIVDEEFGGVV
jgi:hypothetical protein